MLNILIFYFIVSKKLMKNQLNHKLIQIDPIAQLVEHQTPNL